MSSCLNSMMHFNKRDTRFLVEYFDVSFITIRGGATFDHISLILKKQRFFEGLTLSHNITGAHMLIAQSLLLNLQPLRRWSERGYGSTSSGESKVSESHMQTILFNMLNIMVVYILNGNHFY